MAAAAASLVQVSRWMPRSAEQVLRLHQHVEQVAHRRALVAADVGDARLQQRLGHGQDALAVEGVAGAEPQALDLLVERNFSHCAALVSSCPRCSSPGSSYQLAPAWAELWIPNKSG